MAQRALRFGITDGGRRRAATWKLWTETAGDKSEVYLACRSLGGTLKASLHDSGHWHIAYTQSAFERYVEGANPKHADRFIEKWPRPHEFAPGITLAFRIVTPWSAVTNLIDGSKSKGVIWLPNASEPKATEIDILFTAPTTPVSDWPGRRSMNTSLVGSVRLQNGETIWVVYWVVDMPKFSSFGERTFRFYKGRSEKDLESEGLRMLAFGTEPDGSRVIYDCAVHGRKPNKPMQATQ